MLDYLSFSAFDSIWFWIVMCVQWINILMRPVGIPFYLVIKPDYASTLLAFAQVRQTILLLPTHIFVFLVSGFVISLLFVLSVFYGLEPAIALLFLLIPQGIVYLWSKSIVRKFQFDDLAMIRTALGRHQFQCQIFGAVVVCVASFLGAALHIVVGG